MIRKTFFFSLFSLLVATATSFAAELSAPKTERSYSWFVRPLVGRLMPKSDYRGQYGDVTAVGLAGGLQLGAKRSHELSVEYTQANWSWSTYGIRMEERLEPVLFNYVYKTGTAGSPVRFFAGPSLGLARVSSCMRLSHDYSYSHWVSTVAGNIGAEFAFCRHFSASLFYRYQHVATPGVNDQSLQGILDGGTGNAVFGSLSFRF